MGGSFREWGGSNRTKAFCNQRRINIITCIINDTWSVGGAVTDVALETRASNYASRFEEQGIDTWKRVPAPGLTPHEPHQPPRLADYFFVI